MRFSSIAFLGMVCLLAIACHNASNVKHSATVSSTIIDTSKTEDVSLINLIATPERFNGRKVRVIGYLHLEFEDCVLCLNKEDYVQGISKNGIWAGIKTKRELVTLYKFSDHYVIMEGIFNIKMNGHGGMNSGSIQNISRLEIWK
jgi:hypothetical protein